MCSASLPTLYSVAGCDAEMTVIGIRLSDLMNRPDRWAAVRPEQVRARCRQLGMSPHDADTVRDLVQRRKEGRRFNVRSSYRSFRFD